MYYLAAENRKRYRNRAGLPLAVDNPIVVPAKYRDDVLALAHDALIGGGHQGYAKTYGMLKKWCYWPGMQRDVQDYCRTCDVCQRRNVQPERPGKMTPMPTPPGRWEQVGMDLVGPLPKSANGMEYLLVLTDYLTKWPEVRALPDKKSQTVAIGLLKIFGTWGIPATLISDQGNEFTSAAIKAVYQYLGIERKASTPHHPQTNGLTERFNRTLKDMIAKITLTCPSPWDDVLEWVLGNYRAMPQKTTGDSPFFLEKGRDPFLPLDTMKNRWPERFGRNVDLVGTRSRKRTSLWRC